MSIHTADASQVSVREERNNVEESRCVLENRQDFKWFEMRWDKTRQDRANPPICYLSRDCIDWPIYYYYYVNEITSVWLNWWFRMCTALISFFIFYILSFSWNHPKPFSEFNYFSLDHKEKYRCTYRVTLLLYLSLLLFLFLFHLSFSLDNEITGQEGGEGYQHYNS